MKTQVNLSAPYYTAKLYCSAVSANLANDQFQGIVECREMKENGKSKKLWRKRTGQKMRRTTARDALIDAVNMAQEIKKMSGGVSVDIAILGSIN